MSNFVVNVFYKKNVFEKVLIRRNNNGWICLMDGEIFYVESVSYCSVMVFGSNL